MILAHKKNKTDTDEKNSDGKDQEREKAVIILEKPHFSIEGTLAFIIF